MEEIKVSKLKMFILILAIFVISSLIHNMNDFRAFDIKGESLIFLLVLLVVISIELLRKLKKGGTYFSKEGITFISRNKNYTSRWEHLRVTKKNLFKYYARLVFNVKTDDNYQFELFLFWPTEDDIFEKTKKYCPKDCEFYKIVEEYARKRKIPF